MEKIFQKILDKINDAVFFLDEDKNVCFWNKSAEELSGYLMEEALNVRLNHSITMFIDEEGEEFCFNFDTLENNSFEIVDNLYLHHKHGYRVAVSVKFIKLFDEENNKNIFAGIFNKKPSAEEIVKKLEILRQKNMTDAVTGVGNRECAEAVLSYRFEEFERFGINFGLLLFDIDDFKIINDKYGWDVGDMAVKMVTQSAVSSLRTVDVVCRWGVDEFIAIIPDTNIKELKKIGEKIRKFVELSWFKYDDDKISVTVSLGGVIAKPNETIEAIVFRADKIRQSSDYFNNKVTVK
jgi:diguanylate cyclase (GGDEF)-like protein/PAS domain S-box-containing protein